MYIVSNAPAFRLVLIEVTQKINKINLVAKFYHAISGMKQEMFAFIQIKMGCRKDVGIAFVGNQDYVL